VRDAILAWIKFTTSMLFKLISYFLDCSEHEEKCIPSFACLPRSHFCDGVANCEMGDDESCQAGI
jgi:hypothetical protein